MSAAFALTPTGPRVNCDFRGCVLEAWHDGNHEFALKATPKFSPDRIHSCIICGVRFVIYGEADSPSDRRICDKPECLLALARNETGEAPLLCPCPQREYPHELSVHSLIRHEWWRKELRGSWPWSLMQSLREEPSTERRS